MRAYSETGVVADMRFPTLLAGVIALFLTCAGTCSGGTAAPPASPPEWVLNYDLPELGEHEVFWSKDAVKVRNLRLGFEWIVRAPNWEYVVVRRAEKSIGRAAHLTWRNITIMTFKEHPKFGVPKLDGMETLAGIKADRFREGSTLYFCAQDMPVDARAIKAFCTYFELPSFSQVPLGNFTTELSRSEYKAGGWLKHEDYVGSRSNYKLRVRSRRQVPYNAQDFEIPKNFKLTSVQNVMLGTSKQKQLESALEDLGFTSEPVIKRH